MTFRVNLAGLDPPGECMESARVQVTEEEFGLAGFEFRAAFEERTDVDASMFDGGQPEVTFCPEVELEVGVGAQVQGVAFQADPIGRARLPPVAEDVPCLGMRRGA